MSKLNILGVPIDRVDMNSALSKIVDYMENRDKCIVCTPNSEIVMQAQNNKELWNFINEADLVVPDGIGLVAASRIIGKPLKERVTGIDLMERVLWYCDMNRKNVFIMGGKPGVAQKAAENISCKYPDINFCGINHGYFKGLHIGQEGHEEEMAVIDKINSASPDVLFVALGAPKQELWINKYAHMINANVIMGVGGSTDVYAGEVKRAPQIYQNLGLEWFYRLIKEPWRYKRMMALPKFVVEVLKRGES